MKQLLLIFAYCSVIHAKAQLSREDAEKSANQAWDKYIDTLRKERAEEMKESSITIGDKTMKLLAKTFGEKPEGGRPLVISMHGGGHAPAQVNDQQWQNQIKLYQPEGSIYVAPRAPTNEWNLWHLPHIDLFFDRLIENCVALYGINPDKVYLMGYSAGGDGAYQLAPRMSDRFGAVAMMAGHPNETKPDGLRSLPFALLIGGKDTGVNRNVVGRQWGEMLATLEKNNPGQYVHFYRCYEECAHWMNLKDAEAVPWMLKHTRNVWPKHITWLQDDVLGSRYYWLAVDPTTVKAGQRVDAICKEQTIQLDSLDVKEITLRLSDTLIDLDKEITVTLNGKNVFQGKVERKQETIEQSFKERGDRAGVAFALLKVQAK
jgi:poly(3-hydroxybutyrate) depolymerase